MLPSSSGPSSLKTVSLRWLTLKIEALTSLETSVGYHPNETASHRTRLQSSTIPLWEPQISKLDSVKIRTANVALICRFLTSTELLPQLLRFPPRIYPFWMAASVSSTTGTCFQTNVALPPLLYWHLCKKKHNLATRSCFNATPSPRQQFKSKHVAAPLFVITHQQEEQVFIWFIPLWLLSWVEWLSQYWVTWRSNSTAQQQMQIDKLYIKYIGMKYVNSTFLTKQKETRT